MTLRQWRWKVFRYCAGVACAATFLYFIVCAFVEHATTEKIPFMWLHGRVLGTITALALLVGNGFFSEFVPERPKTPDEDERIVEEVRKHLRGE